ncbi:MAG: MBOAT family O-acyltransferase [Candidatus Omnitrophota bacterium]|jgi:D-alanyl-lipoteichoic acid acyltransferase DltB (MBOAT superfamily)
MLFKFIQFLVFFAAVYIPYLFLNHKWQNRLLLVASCIFYAAWDWRFIFLIFVSITIDYFCGLRIDKSDNDKVRKYFLLLSIFVNLSILGFFKYFNFFIANFSRLINHLGFSIHPQMLNILLPLGISFYTFKTISYTIDVYTEKIKPTRSYRDYALFVSFFPLILAGPIMRAGDLLRQIASPRKVQLEGFYKEGCYLIFWGGFQKFFVADNLAIIANKLFNPSPPYNGIMVLLAAYAFAFQIYCDFAGYSNIARGLGKCMGFDIMVNFNLPYFATNPQDFWNRWHISLSNWLREYLYNPISFSLRRWGVWGVSIALMATFLLCGLWHGAYWNYIIWGGYWGILLISYALLRPLLAKIPNPKKAIFQKVWFFIRVIFFFHVICFGWVIFKAEGNATKAFSMLQSLFCNFHWGRGVDIKYSAMGMISFLWLLGIVEIVQYWKNDPMVVYKSNSILKVCFCILCLYLLLSCGVASEGSFIYFQF